MHSNNACACVERFLLCSIFLGAVVALLLCSQPMHVAANTVPASEPPLAPTPPPGEPYSAKYNKPADAPVPEPILPLGTSDDYINAFDGSSYYDYDFSGAADYTFEETEHPNEAFVGADYLIPRLTAREAVFPPLHNLGSHWRIFNAVVCVHVAAFTPHSLRAAQTGCMLYEGV
jgi:hypothetical protein